MDESPDRQLARGLRDGKTEAWQTLYEAYCRRVWGLVARLMGGRAADVGDVVQETFLAAARSAPQYDPARGSLWVWLAAIARNHVALHYRRRKRCDALPDGDPPVTESHRRLLRWLEDGEDAPGDALASAELAAQVRAALTELPVDYETLLTAKYMDGATVDEIAASEQVSAIAVRSKLARARRAFREAFLRTT